MNPWLIIGSLVINILMTGAAYKFGYDNGENKIKASQIAENDLIAKVEERARLGAANEIAKIQLKQTTIYNKVQKEVQTNTVYRECKHTADGLRSLNEALTNTGPISDIKLPDANTSTR
jgi:hypothetical protein